MTKLQNNYLKMRVPKPKNRISEFESIRESVYAINYLLDRVDGIDVVRYPKGVGLKSIREEIGLSEDGGIEGLQGPVGPQGPKGEKGEKGEPGLGVEPKDYLQGMGDNGQTISIGGYIKYTEQNARGITVSGGSISLKPNKVYKIDMITNVLLPDAGNIEFTIRNVDTNTNYTVYSRLYSPVNTAHNTGSGNLSFILPTGEDVTRIGVYCHNIANGSSAELLNNLNFITVLEI